MERFRVGGAAIAAGAGRRLRLESRGDPPPGALLASAACALLAIGLWAIVRAWGGRMLA
jgi:hypothetical protein